MAQTKRIEVPFEVKEASASGEFSGYASVFGLVDHHSDVVVAGAFAKSLEAWKRKGSLPPILWQHNSNDPLGKYTEMVEDQVGLQVKGRLMVDDLAKAREAHALLKEGVVTGLSIGYRTVVDEYNRDEGVWYLKELNLYEVSLVTFPCNDSARITGVKADSINTIRDFEAALRDELGFSRSQAKALASAGWKGIGRDDPRDVVASLESLTARIRAAS